MPYRTNNFESCGQIALWVLIIQALEDRLRKLESVPTEDADLSAIMQISRRCAALPTLDTRVEEEILGYGEEGT